MQLNDIKSVVIDQFKALTEKCSDAAGEVNFKARPLIECGVASVLEDTIIQSTLRIQGGGQRGIANYIVDFKVYITGMPHNTVEIASFTFSGHDKFFRMVGMNVGSYAIKDVAAAHEIIVAIEEYYNGEADTEEHAVAALSPEDKELLNLIITQRGVVSEEAITGLEERLSIALGHVWTPNLLSKISSLGFWNPTTYDQKSTGIPRKAMQLNLS